jgi:hypothetical protein
LVVALAPTAQVKESFSARLASDLPANAFTTSPAVEPPLGLSLTSDPESLRGTD